MTDPLHKVLQVRDPAGDFDPLRRFYTADGARPAMIRPVSLAALTPFQRALLAIDGTVTQFIEAHELEPVEVRRVQQAMRALREPDGWLALPAGATVIDRRVLLLGRRSARLYAWADSVIAAERLSPAMAAALNEEGGGIGRMLIDAGTEARREALWYGRETPAAVPVQAAACGHEFLARAYRVLTGGAPLMLITERFPL